jgi:nitroreductase
MDFMAAINKRISCRAYDAWPIEQEKLDALAAEVARINEHTGMHFQLRGPEDGASTIVLSNRMFAGGVENYLALVAPNDAVWREKVGYFGERLVLLATSLGLGNCWVAGTFDRVNTRFDASEGEHLHDVIPLGYAKPKTPLKQLTIRTAIRGRSRKPESMYEGPTSLAQAPAWIRAGVEAVAKAPSAVNEQPVTFVQAGVGEPIRTSLAAQRTGLEHTDLGIAKLHFEVAAASEGVVGSWEWGERGAFVVS